MRIPKIKFKLKKKKRRIPKIIGKPIDESSALYLPVKKPWKIEKQLESDIAAYMKWMKS